MKCTDARNLFSSYLDDRLSGSQMLAVSGHVEQCGTCAGEFSSLRQTRDLLGSLGRKPAPPDLALRLRVALSRELATRRQPRWGALLVHWQNALNAFLMPATAGAATAVLFFGVLIGGMLALPAPVEASDDVPIVFFTPPQLVASPAQIGMGSVTADAVEVLVIVGANGRVQDYRILGRPENAEVLLPELKHTLIFTVFRPATSFGKPTAAPVVLSFSSMDVRG